jgi:hypothetical protein
MCMSMKRSIGVLVFGLVAAAIAPAELLILPGTPCSEIVGENVPCSGTVTNPTIAEDPLFDLTSDPGVTELGIFVVPGDVVLFETANGSLTDQSTWSDVLEFSDSVTGRGSIATIFPDAEGVGIILPTGFSLSANAVGLPENPAGTGTDADFTTYIAGTATYQVHSDSPCCEVPDVETPEPSSVALLGLALAGVFVLGRRKVLQS